MTDKKKHSLITDLLLDYLFNDLMTIKEAVIIFDKSAKEHIKK